MNDPRDRASADTLHGDAGVADAERPAGLVLNAPIVGAAVDPSRIARDGTVRQGALTVIAPIRPGQKDSLRAVFERIEAGGNTGTDVEDNDIIPFPRLRTIHFARWVIFDEEVLSTGERVPATLALSTNHDLPLEDHLRELAEQAGPGLDLIYRHCEGYPGGENVSPEQRYAYLAAHRARTNTFYVGTVGRSVDQIHREARLRDAIGDFLDQENMAGRLRGRSPAEIRKAIQDFVSSRPDLQWAMTPPRKTPFPWSPGSVIAAVVLAIGAVAYLVSLVTNPGGTLRGTAWVLGTVLAAFLVWAILLRIHEKRDERTARESKLPEPTHTSRLARREDQVVQNQLSSIIEIKPGWFRRFTLNIVLTVIDLAARYIYNRGSLGGIPSIHFARWVVVDGGRRLAFFSNFDGSWESYLGDFVDRAATGLTAVWSNCVGFPRTRWLVLDGAADEQRFKAYARDRQILTNVWYSAYKRLSVQNINNNSEIRRGLTGPMSPDEVQAWLRRF